MSVVNFNRAAKVEWVCTVGFGNDPSSKESLWTGEHAVVKSLVLKTMNHLLSLLSIFRPRSLCENIFKYAIGQDEFKGMCVQSEVCDVSLTVWLQSRAGPYCPKYLIMSWGSSGKAGHYWPEPPNFKQLFDFTIQLHTQYRATSTCDTNLQFRVSVDTKMFEGPGLLDALWYTFFSVFINIKSLQFGLEMLRLCYMSTWTAAVTLINCFRLWSWTCTDLELYLIVHVCVELKACLALE